MAILYYIENIPELTELNKLYFGSKKYLLYAEYAANNVKTTTDVLCLHTIIVSYFHHTHIIYNRLYLLILTFSK